MLFLAYRPNDDNRPFSELYGVRCLKSCFTPADMQVCISTIQRMYSILQGEELDESTEGESFHENPHIDQRSPKEAVYNAKYLPEFFDVIIHLKCLEADTGIFRYVPDWPEHKSGQRIENMCVIFSCYFTDATPTKCF